MTRKEISGLPKELRLKESRISAKGSRYHPLSSPFSWSNASTMGQISISPNCKRVTHPLTHSEIIYFTLVFFPFSSLGQNRALFPLSPSSLSILNLILKRLSDMVSTSYTMRFISSVRETSPLFMASLGL